MTETATLAGGCFWCLEAVYELLRGVEHVESGYIGGHVPHPTYAEVCTGMTGHAEAVRVTFDPAVIGYRDLLDGYVIDHADMSEVVSIDARVMLAQTLMTTMEDREALARTVLEAATVLRRHA